METKVRTLTHLTKGRATWTGELEVDLYIDTENEEARILPILEPDEVPVTSSVPKISYRTGSAGGIPANRTGELSLPKTYLTRKGALLLFTAPENVELTPEQRKLIRKGLMKNQKNIMKEKFGTLEKFTRSVLEFGNEDTDDQHVKSAGQSYFFKFLRGTEDYRAYDWRLKPGGDLSSYLRILKERTASDARNDNPVHQVGMTSVQLSNAHQHGSDQEDAEEQNNTMDSRAPEISYLTVHQADKRTRPVSAPESVLRRRIGSGGLLQHRKLSAERLVSNLKSTYLGRPSSSDKILSGGKYARLRDDPFSNTPSTRPNSPSTRPNTPSTRPSSVRSQRSRPVSSRSRRSSSAAIENQNGNTLTPVGDESIDPKQRELQQEILKVDGVTIMEEEDVTGERYVSEESPEFSDGGSEVHITPDGGMYALNIDHLADLQGLHQDELFQEDIAASLPRVRILSPVESVPSEDLDEANSDYELNPEPVISVEIRSGRSSVASSHSGIPSRPTSGIKETPAHLLHSLTSEALIELDLKNEQILSSPTHESHPISQETLDLPINQDNKDSEQPINQGTPKVTPSQSNETQDLHQSPITDGPQIPEPNAIGFTPVPRNVLSNNVDVDGSAHSSATDVHKNIENVHSLNTAGNSNGKVAAPDNEELASKLKTSVKIEAGRSTTEQDSFKTNSNSVEKDTKEKKENLASQTTKELERLFGPPKPPKSPPKKGKETQIRRHKKQKQGGGKDRKKGKSTEEVNLTVQQPESRRVSFEDEVLENGIKEQDSENAKTMIDSGIPDKHPNNEGQKEQKVESDDDGMDDKPGGLTLADLEMEQNVFRGHAQTVVDDDESSSEEDDFDFEEEDDEEVKEKRQKKRKPAKKEKKVVSEEEMRKMEEEKARQRQEREEAKKKKLLEMLDLQQKIKEKEEEMMKQEQEAINRKKKLEEDIEWIANEAEIAKQAELAARQKLASQRKAAKEEREAKRRIELEKKKAEAAKKRDRERKVTEGATMRERMMLNNISGGSRAELLMLDEQRRKEMEWDEEQRILEEERLMNAANDEEEHLTMLDMLAEEQAMSHLVTDRKNAEEMKRTLEEKAERLKIVEEQEREQILREQRKLDEIQRQKEEEERQRREEEMMRLKELERQEEEKRELVKQQAFQKRQMLLVRRDQNLDRRTNLQSLKEEQGVTRPWVFSYYVQWPMESYERLMTAEDGKKPSSGKSGRGKSGKKSKKGKKGKKKK